MTTTLDLVGITALAVLAFIVWPPAALGVVGVGALVASWRLESASGEKGDDA